MLPLTETDKWSSPELVPPQVPEIEGVVSLVLRKLTVGVKIADTTLTGIPVIVFAYTEIAPAIEHSLPLSTHPAPIEAAPLAINVPDIVVPAAMAIAPSAIQKTFDATAPLVRTIVAAAAVVKAPPILKMKIELGFP
jgi:hypothetical protein